MSQIKLILAAAIVLVSGTSRADDQLEALTTQKERPVAIIGVEHENQAYLFGLKKELSTTITDAGKAAQQALEKAESVPDAIADVQKSHPKATAEMEVTKILLTNLIVQNKLEEKNDFAQYLGKMPIAKKATQSQLEDPAYASSAACGIFGWGRRFIRPVVFAPAVVSVGFVGGFVPGCFSMYNSFGWGWGGGWGWGWGGGWWGHGGCSAFW